MKKIYVLLCSAFSLTLLSAQNIEWGLQVAINYSQITEIGKVEGVSIDRTAGSNPQRQPGFYTGVYTSYDLNNHLSLRGELGYELLRFKSDFFVFPAEIRRLHHFKLGTQLVFQPLSWWSIAGGAELMHRSNETMIEGQKSQWGKLNGNTTEGIFLQPLVASYFMIYRSIEIGLKANLPRIQSISRIRLDAFSPDRGDHIREHVEQLLPYQLSISIPIIFENAIYSESAVHSRNK